MKVALFTDSEVFAGTERHILDLAIGLQGEGVEVEIACPARGILAQRGQLVGIPIFPIEKSSGLDLGAVRRLGERFRSRRIDLVHSHNGRTLYIAALAAAVGRRGHSVATQHFTEPARLLRRGLKGWLGRGLHRLISTRTDHVVAISNVVRNGILEREEAPAERVTMVWNGIADPRKGPLRAEADIRAEFQIPVSAPLIVSAARLESEKAVDVLIDAFAQLREILPAAHCLVAGEGRQRANLQAQIDRLGVGNTMRLIGYQTGVLSIVHAADVFVLPSPAEPFGLALVEAMALGRPVVATRAGGPIEIVQDTQSGLLVSPSTPSELRDAIAQILMNKELADGLGRKARQRFLNCFTAERMAREMKAVYERTIG